MGNVNSLFCGRTEAQRGQDNDETLSIFTTATTKLNEVDDDVESRVSLIAQQQQQQPPQQHHITSNDHHHHHHHQQQQQQQRHSYYSNNQQCTLEHDQQQQMTTTILSSDEMDQYDPVTRAAIEKKIQNQLQNCPCHAYADSLSDDNSNNKSNNNDNNHGNIPPHNNISQQEQQYPTYQDLLHNNNIGTDIQPQQLPILQPKIHVYPTGPLQCNMIIIADPLTNDAILIDPGGPHIREVHGHKHRVKYVAVQDVLKELNYNIKKIFLTHAHFDHILGLGVVRELYPDVEIYLHYLDKVLFQFLPVQLSMVKMSIPTADFQKIGKPTHFFNHTNDPIIKDIGMFGGQILYTPGHTEGSICLYFPQCGLLCSGDTLFKNGVGRTDLQDGNFDALKQSILTQLYTLPDNIMVIPGHGARTLIGLEKRNNPVVRCEVEREYGL